MLYKTFYLSGTLHVQVAVSELYSKRPSMYLSGVLKVQVGIYELPYSTRPSTCLEPSMYRPVYMNYCTVQDPLLDWYPPCTAGISELPYSKRPPMYLSGVLKVQVAVSELLYSKRPSMYLSGTLHVQADIYELPYSTRPST